MHLKMPEMFYALAARTNTMIYNTPSLDITCKDITQRYTIIFLVKPTTILFYFSVNLPARGWPSNFDSIGWLCTSLTIQHNWRIKKDPWLTGSGVRTRSQNWLLTLDMFVTSFQKSTQTNSNVNELNEANLFLDVKWV